MRGVISTMIISEAEAVYPPREPVLQVEEIADDIICLTIGDFDEPTGGIKTENKRTVGVKADDLRRAMGFLLSGDKR